MDNILLAMELAQWSCCRCCQLRLAQGIRYLDRVNFGNLRVLKLDTQSATFPLPSSSSFFLFPFCFSGARIGAGFWSIVFAVLQCSQVDRETVWLRLAEGRFCTRTIDESDPWMEGHFLWVPDLSMDNCMHSSILSVPWSRIHN